MTKQFYAVYDLKAAVYLAPYLEVNDATAIRVLKDAVGDQNTSVARHPEDYQLFCIGEYNDASGQVAPYVPVRHVINATAVVAVPDSAASGQPELKVVER